MKTFKKIVAFMLVAFLMLSMAACGGEKEGGSGGEKTEAPKNAIATVNWDKAKAYIIGAELCEDDTTIRLYYEYTNLSDIPDSAYNSVRMELTQNGEELEENYVSESDEIDALATNAVMSVQTGFSVRAVLTYELLDESKISVKLYDYDEEESDVNFELDPANLPGKPTTTFTMKGVSDPEHAADADESGTYRDDFEIAIKKMEVFEDDGKKLARIFFDFTNNGEEAESMEFVTFMDVYQDGVELHPANPSESVESDDNFAGDTEVGETSEVSICYVLRSENPVEVAFYEFDEVVIGKVIPVK